MKDNITEDQVFEDYEGGLPEDFSLAGARIAGSMSISRKRLYRLLSTSTTHFSRIFNSLLLNKGCLMKLSSYSF